MVAFTSASAGVAVLDQCSVSRLPIAKVHFQRSMTPIDQYM
jgi:hypothetical protein